MNGAESSKLFLLPGAGVAELADAQDLGSCGVTPVEVQVLSPAPIILSDTAALEVSLQRRRCEGSRPDSRNLGTGTELCLQTVEKLYCFAFGS